MTCVRCGRRLPPGPYGRRDTCPGCGADLHACVQCTFYAPGHYNNCREPQAERVLDPEKANFCDYFRPTGAAAGPAAVDPKAEAKARLDALFKGS
ncbi:MAG: hypothetical protein SCH98_04775 [Deferrisomatales bacterium]|nr:hypothetical protein [Deferrisomatales bacterium]